MPDYFYNELKLYVSPGNVSRFFVEAAEEKILDKKMVKKDDPFGDFFALRRVAPKISDKQIMNAIKKGRM